MAVKAEERIPEILRQADVLGKDARMVSASASR
jgi:hypothetical protein